MRVDKLMTPDVQTCGANDALDRAARLMWERDCGCIPVTDGPKVLGMITDRDICMAAFTQGKPLHEIPVHQVMAREVISCSPSDHVIAAEAKMREHRIRRLPVIKDGKLVGILSLNDLATAAQHDPRDGLPYEEVANTLASICAHRLPSLMRSASARG